MAEIEVGIDTYQDRESARKAYAAQQADRKRKREEKERNKEWHQQHKGDAGVAEIKKAVKTLADAVSNQQSVIQAIATQIPQTPASSSSQPKARGKGHPKLAMITQGGASQISFNDGYDLQRASLARILDAMGNAASNLISCARILNEEGGQIRMVAQQSDINHP